MQPRKPETGLPGDTPQRDYAQKLRLFNAFVQPELCEAIDALSIQAGSRVLDAGCGTGEALGWWHASMRGNGMAVGMDLAAAHVCAARAIAPVDTPVVQGDLQEPPFPEGSYDLVWAVNVVNHLHDPLPVCVRCRGSCDRGDAWWWGIVHWCPTGTSHGTPVSKRA